MKVTLLLADSAQVADGKLYVLGGGWSLIGPQPSPFGIAIKVEVPWDQANSEHTWELALMTADGEPARPQGSPDGADAIKIGGSFEVGRPPGLPQGSPIDMPIAVNSAPLPLDPGARYRWELSIDGHHDPDWSVGFFVRRARS